MNIFLIVIGTFLMTWMLTNLFFTKLLKANNLFPAFLVGLGVALIVWGIIG